MPLTLYSLHEARNLIETETEHPYDIEAVKKAAKKGSLVCFWIGEEPVFTKENVLDYLWKHGRYKPTLLPPTEVKE